MKRWTYIVNVLDELISMLHCPAWNSSVLFKITWNFSDTATGSFAKNANKKVASYTLVLNQRSYVSQERATKWNPGGNANFNGIKFWYITIEFNIKKIQHVKYGDWVPFLKAIRNAISSRSEVWHTTKNNVRNNSVSCQISYTINVSLYSQ